MKSAPSNPGSTCSRPRRGLRLAAWLPALLVMALPAAGQTAASDAPNVLLLVADDLGVDGVGACAEGSGTPATPVLDSLAANGILFRNAWVAPLCSPTRAQIQTGRHAFRTGIGYAIGLSSQARGLPLTEVTLPEMLDLGTSGAYAHAAFGKWHLGGADVGGDLAPNLAGYSHFAGTPSNLVGGASYTSWTKVVDGVSFPTTVYATTDTVDSALAWLATAPEPWLCYVAFHAPHEPFHAPPANLHSIDLSGAGDPKTNPRPYYAAMVEALDTEIGRLLAGLSPAVRDRTTTIFLGDNGTPAPATVQPFDASHAKGTVFEGGLNVPLIVEGASVRVPGRESLALVSAVDVFGTVAELAGVDLDSTLPGVPLDSVSFVPVLSSTSVATVRNVVVEEHYFPNFEPVGQANLAYCADPTSCGGCAGTVGFGPTTSQLAVCGTGMYGLQLGRLTLQGAQPGAIGLLAYSLGVAPKPTLGGVLIPAFPAFAPIAADPTGTFTKLGAFATQTSQSVFYQALTTDGTKVDFSNTVEVTGLRAHFLVARESRYKLIADVVTGEQRLFDLRDDPFEQVDLLALGNLSKRAQDAYDLMLPWLDRLYPDAPCPSGCAAISATALPSNRGARGTTTSLPAASPAAGPAAAIHGT